MIDIIHHSLFFNGSKNCAAIKNCEKINKEHLKNLIMTNEYKLNPVHSSLLFLDYIIAEEKKIERYKSFSVNSFFYLIGSGLRISQFSVFTSYFLYDKNNFKLGYSGVLTQRIRKDFNSINQHRSRTGLI